MRNLTQVLAAKLAVGCAQIGEIMISPWENGFALRHFDDAARGELGLFREADDARELAKLDDAGSFRPLKSAPTLRHGWELRVASVGELRQALDHFYPAMLGVLASSDRGELGSVPLRETLARQSGMYAVTRKITDAAADATIGEFCKSDGGCLKTILWPLALGQPVTSLPATKFDPQHNQTGRPARALPLLCHEACNLLVARLREVVKSS